MANNGFEYEETDEEESSEDTEWSLGDWSIDSDFSDSDWSDDTENSGDLWTDDGEPVFDVSGLFGGAGFWVRQAGRGIDGAVKLAELVAKYGYWAVRDKLREIKRRQNNRDDYDDEDEHEDEDWDIGFEDNS